MNHVSIRVNTLRGDQKTDFDLYLKIDGRMVLYVHSGDSFSGTRLQNLKRKKLKKMYIRPEHEAMYRAYVQRNLEEAYDSSSNKPIEVRAEIIHGEQQGNVEKVFEQPENAENYNTAKAGVQQYVDFLLKTENAVQAIMKIDNTDKSVSHHGVNVATLATALAQKFAPSTDPKQIQLMALGALLHDLGHQDSPINLLQPVKNLVGTERDLYLKHPDVGAGLVQDKKHFDQLVTNIIAQHEECINGTGYPRGLTEREMDPLVVMVGTSNAMDRLVTFESVPRAEAGRKLMLEKVGQYPLPQIQALLEILKKV